MSTTTLITDSNIINQNQNEINNNHNINLKINNNDLNTYLSIFNFFKIYSLLYEFKTIFENIFRYRFKQELSVEWVSTNSFQTSPNYNKFIQLFPYYYELKEDQKLKINSDVLENWGIELIAIILNKIDYKTISKSKIENENKIILTIKLYYLKVSKLRELKQFYLDENEIIKIDTLINESYSLIDHSVIGNYTNGIVDNFEIIINYDELEGDYTGEEIKKELFSKDQVLNTSNFCYQFKERLKSCLKEEEYKEMKHNTIVTLQTFAREHVSPSLKSRVYCSKSLLNLLYFKYITFQDNNSKIQRSKVLILEAREDALDSIREKYTYYEGYYRLAETFKVCGEYEIALKYYDIALALDPTDLELQQARNTTFKLWSSRIYHPITGKRDFEQEAINFIKENQFLNLDYISRDQQLEDGANQQSKNDNYESNKLFQLINEPFKSQFMKVYKENKIYGYGNDYRILEAMAMQSDAVISLLNGNETQAYETLLKSIQHSNLCFSYLYLSEFYRIHSAFKEIPNVVKDPIKELTLFLQATVLSTSPKICIPSNKKLETHMIESNTNPNYCKLGSKFFYGIYGLDLDFERAIYYFNKSTENLELNGTLKYYNILIKSFDEPLFKYEKDMKKATLLIKKLTSKDPEKGKIVSSYLDSLKVERQSLFEIIHNDSTKNCNNNISKLKFK